MRLSGPHRLLLPDVLEVGAPYALVLGGGYALQAHGLVDRTSRTLDLVTETPTPMADVASALRAGLEARGWRVTDLTAEPLSARLEVRGPGPDAMEGPGDDGPSEVCTVDAVKETLWRPVVPGEYGPVLAVEDAVGLKVRALADLGLARDLVDVWSGSDRWSYAGLEEWGRRHGRDAFDPADLQARLERSEWIDDREFAAYGLDETATAALRRWAQLWADDIAERLMEEAPVEDEL
ncbi:nucleotidyl transferase AbiEii/AbiGii toxin family protein [Streptomyces syringium]|uniref:nucleotidyl transferase AbiEii/AbiGii toxin family protein n=1 Tax=Streptomyces syringium TaxID=76729 RepID=UPI003453E7FF